MKTLGSGNLTSIHKPSRDVVCLFATCHHYGPHVCTCEGSEDQD